jgi:hypothetical protein
VLLAVLYACRGQIATLYGSIWCFFGGAGSRVRSGRGEVHRIITEPHSGCGNWEQNSCNQWKCVYAPRSEQRAPNQFRFKQHPRADEHGADLRTNPHRWIRPMRAPAPDALIWHRRDALGLPSGVSEHIVNGGDHVGDAQNVSSAQRFVGEIIWSIAVGF